LSGFVILPLAIVMQNKKSKNPKAKNNKKGWRMKSLREVQHQNPKKGKWPGKLCVLKQKPWLVKGSLTM
jgi:hypothetical protein